MTPVTQAVIVCVPDGGDPSREVGGLSLIERLLRQLSELGSLQEILIVRGPRAGPAEPSCRVATPVRVVRVAPGDPWTMLRAASGFLRERFLVIGADLLVDPRILSWLAARTADTLVTANAREPELLGTVGRTILLEPPRSLASAAVVAITDFPAYWKEQRGDVPVHLLRVTSDRDAEEGWRVLLDHVQKRTLDLPARYFDPTFENVLVRLLCRTRITPNQVTAATGLLGFGVAGLFATGWLRVGVLLAIVVEVLDGVDGKLARIKRMTSKPGELEHVLDFFYENSWYVALGFRLSTHGHPWAWGAALAMVAFDVTDNLANIWVSRFRGRNLAEVSSFLRRFRRISGRRNIYAWIFLPGFLLGTPAFSFAAAVVWAGITAAVHVISAIVEPELASSAARR
ncbi:MAG: CDP-alcohol phosphatidyltransferase family protein [Candidatus Rokubacteria bacterium]|nr:CDP-alcohol phosphatidyltransferase family protein [Candidatus Rokubacteria bacterium]